MKKFFTKAHLWLSIPFGLIIAIICITGSLLVFENEILEARYPSRYFVKVSNAHKLAPSELLQRVQQNQTEPIQFTGIRIYSEADRTSKLYVSGKGDDLFVNPYTGEITGKDERSTFFSKVIRLHRFLMHQPKAGEQRWGKMAVGYSTIAFIFIIISGLVIWLPRSRKGLKNRLKIKTNAGWFRFWYDLHVTGGFYVAFFLLAMAFTGLTWSFPWYRTAFYSLLGADMSQGSGHRRGGQTKERDQKELDTLYLQWDKVLAELNIRYPEYKSITLQDGNASVSATYYGNAGATDKFTFNKETGEITNEALYKDSSRYSQLRGWVWAFHSGSWGGMTTRILTCLSAFLGGIFVITGYYFWIRKKVKSRRR